MTLTLCVAEEDFDHHSQSRSGCSIVQDDPTRVISNAISKTQWPTHSQIIVRTFLFSVVLGPTKFLRRITSPGRDRPNNIVDISKSFITTNKEIIFTGGFQSIELVT